MIRFLTQNQASLRAAAVKTGVTYRMYLNLEKGKHFNGLTLIDFEATDVNNVFLDFGGKTVDYLEINDKHYKDDSISGIWKEGYIHLPNDAIKVGKNQVLVKFRNDYNTDGNGLHTYTDVDGKQYIYCQSEPYWINRVYPIFDQPDIKAYMNYYILSPNDWEIISNENSNVRLNSKLFLEKNKNSDDSFLKTLLKHSEQDFNVDNKDMYVFNQTPLISTYLHAFVGGPYKRIDLADHENTAPMSIYCRDSLFKFAEEQQTGIFKFGVEGIKFYNEFFKVPFPFTKYDYVFCPEYTVGAMEYPGVITYNDRFIYREKPNRVQVSNLGGVINHELAHMWFGNLVTMKWWNDLWLNESFADFVCYLCNAVIADKLPFDTIDSWSSFCLRKNWGYDEDQAVTTHPIACTVTATNQADSIFDGITYSKGASVLKQLYFLMGHDNFSKNISNYFNKYKWSNTTLDNFMEELNNFENESGHEAYDLMKWQESWIKKAGLNAVEVEWDPNTQGKSKVTFRQTAVSPDHPTLRYHKIEVAFFDENGVPALVQTVLLDDKPETVIEIDNKEYKAVLPNYNDWGFIKIILDKHSREFFYHNLTNLDKTLTQLLVVRSLYEMVKDSKLKGADFISGLLNGFLENTLSNIQAFDSVSLFIEKVVFHYLPRNLKFSVAHDVFCQLHQIHNKTQEFEKKQLLKKKLLSFGINDDDIDILKGYLDNSFDNDDKTLNIQNKWNIVFKINASKKYDNATKQQYIEKMESMDNSDTRKTYKMMIENLRADKEQRKQLWAKYIDPALEMSYVALQENFAGFFSIYVPDDLKLSYSIEMLNNLDEICKTRSKEMGDCFLNYCLPENDHAQLTIDHLSGVLEKLSENEDYFRIKIRKIIDEKQKQMKSFALYQQ